MPELPASTGFSTTQRPVPRPTWLWLIGAGTVLAAGAVFGPLPAALLVLALLGALVLLRGWPVSGMVLLVAAAMLTHFKADVGPVSVRPEHLAILLVGALWLWQIIIHQRPFRLDWPAFFALAWFGLNVGATLANAPDPGDSLRHIFRLSLMVATYVVGINLLRTPRSWTAAFHGFLLLAFGEAAFGLIALALYRFGINVGVQTAWVLTHPVPYGTLEEGNMFGSHSAAWLIAFLALFLAHSARFSSLRSKLSGLSLPLGAAVAGTGLAVLLSFSRGAWLALLVGLALLFVYYSPRSRGQYLRGTLLALGGPFLVISLLLLIQTLPESVPLAARLRTFTTLANDPTVNSRLGNYYEGLMDWAAHPWLGWGPGTFYQLHGIRNWAPAWLSNQIVRTLQETGVFGLLAYGGFVVTLLWAAARGIRRASNPHNRAALLGLTLGFVVLQVAYQATDGTWLAAMWVQAALLASGARLIGDRQIGKSANGKWQMAQSAIRNPQSQIRNPQSPIPLLFIHSSDEMYGSDVVLLELLRRLDRTRFAPLVALPTDITYEQGQARLSDELTKLSIPVRHIDFAVLRRRYLSPRGLPGFARRLWRGSRELADWMRSADVALVHANTVAVLGGALAAKLAGRPLLWHVHEIIVEPRWLRWLIARLVTAAADRIVVISGPVAEHLLGLGAARGARDKVIVIPDAVDTERFNPANDGAAAREAWGIRPDQVLIGMAGRIHTWKGQGVLVEAARLLRDRCAEARFVIAGDIVPGQPEPKEALEAAIAAGGLADRVQLVGFWPDARQVMAGLDVLALPSTAPEPFGLVVLEAMASGKPVIATAAGGPLEIVGDGETGLLVPPRDPAALADAIERLVRDPDLRARMAAAGRRRAVEKFGFAAHIVTFERVYQALLASKVAIGFASRRR